METKQFISGCYIKRVIVGFWILEHEGPLQHDMVRKVLQGKQIPPNHIESPCLVPNKIRKNGQVSEFPHVTEDRSMAQKKYRDMLCQSRTQHKTN
jgi:hypothetical protein